MHNIPLEAVCDNCGVVFRRNNYQLRHSRVYCCGECACKASKKRSNTRQRLGITAQPRQTFEKRVVRKIYITDDIAIRRILNELFVRQLEAEANGQKASLTSSQTNAALDAIRSGKARHIL